MPIPLYVEIIKNFSDTITLSDSLTITRTNKSYSLNISDNITLSDVFSSSYSHTTTSYSISITDNITLSESITMTRVESIDISNIRDTITVSDVFTPTFSKRNVDFVTYSLLKVNGNVISNVQQIEVSKSMDEFDATSNFTATLNNYTGRYADDFNLNDEVTIFADLDVNPPTTKIFTGIIEDIKYSGRELNERLILSGRDYGAILQDIMVSPRVFKTTEVSSIVSTLMTQNASGTGITWSNIDVTTLTLDKIIFTNKSLYDCIRELAEIAGFYFYIDVNKDLHFEERNSISSGETFSKGNVLSSDFTNTDADIFNRITVYGDRVLTGYRETYPTVTTGSVYILDSKPSNVFMIGSDGTAAGFVLQPGGVFQFDDPETDDVKWLVDYESKKVILTNGAAAGNNIGWVGSGVIIDYQRSTPIISIKQDLLSQTTYGRKDKTIIDSNLKSLSEASNRATTYLSEHKDSKLMGNLDIYGVVDITPGHTCIVDLPFNNINTQTYTILEARYIFNINNNLSNKVLKLKLNKKVKNFIDYFKEQELRLRNLESANTDTSVIETVTATAGSIIVVENGWKVLTRPSTVGSFGAFPPGAHGGGNVFSSGTTAAWFVMPSAGSVTDVNFNYTTMSANNLNVQCAIYQYTPGSLFLGSTPFKTISGYNWPTSGWKTISFTTPLGLAAGSYALAVYSNRGFYIRYDDGVDRGGTLATAEYFPSSWTGGSASFTDDRVYSIYANYDVNPSAWTAQESGGYL